MLNLEATSLTWKQFLEVSLDLCCGNLILLFLKVSLKRLQYIIASTKCSCYCVVIETVSSLEEVNGITVVFILRQEFMHNYYRSPKAYITKPSNATCINKIDI